MDIKKLFRKKEEVVEKAEEKSKLDQELEVMIDSLKEVDGDSDQYAKICDNAKKVAELKVLVDAPKEVKEVKPEEVDKSKKLNINTIVTVGGYLAGMILVLVFESDGGVITSRALQFLPKPRI